MSTPAPQTPTDADYLALKISFWNGDVTKSSKADLQRYATMLSLPKAHGHFNQHSYPQVCETVRTLLMLRVSEEAGRQTLLLGAIAIAVAVAALLWSVFMFAASK